MNHNYKQLPFILASAIAQQASDVIIKVNLPPMIKVAGTWTPLPDAPVFFLNDVSAVAEEFLGRLPDDKRSVYETNAGAVDLGIDYDEGLVSSLVETTPPEEIGDLAEQLTALPNYRFRVNVFKASGIPEIVIRVLNNGFLRSIDSIGLPKGILAPLSRKKGFIIVTGATGSGKSTTLAAMIDHINNEREAHVISIEDPIEYFHTSKKSIITQIEVGRDTSSFNQALRSAMRQAPDVIMVGELRDRDSVSSAISAAETGHLVLGTLHTNSAVETVSRLVDFFPADHHDQISSQLSATLAMIISQDLIPAADGKRRVLAYEILANSIPVATSIRERSMNNLARALADRSDGLTIEKERTLANLVRNGTITAETALAHANDPKRLKDLLGGL